MIDDLQVAKKYLQLNHSAVDRGIEFSLSLKKVRQLLKQEKCYFTKEPFVNEVNHPKQKSIDRLDNAKGYTDSNTVACHTSINMKKGNLSLSEINTIYKGIKHLL